MSKEMRCLLIIAKWHGLATLVVAIVYFWPS